MQHRIFRWFITECKRAKSSFWRITAGALILICAAGFLLAAAVYIINVRSNDTNLKVQVGYVSDDEYMTGLAISYVQGIKSVKDWCSLIKTDVDTGMKMLEEGEIIALAVLPDDIIGKIISGSNEHATVYLRGTGSSGSGGVSMLGTALIN